VWHNGVFYIEKDSESGKLDFLMQAATAEKELGQQVLPV